MLKIEIPNRKPIAAEHLVLDYNGTLASDGKLIDGVRELLKDISQNLKIHVITADTFGTVTSNFANTNIEVKIIGDKDQGNQKGNYSGYWLMILQACSAGIFRLAQVSNTERIMA